MFWAGAALAVETTLYAAVAQQASDKRELYSDFLLAAVPCSVLIAGLALARALGKFDWCAELLQRGLESGALIHGSAAAEAEKSDINLAWPKTGNSWYFAQLFATIAAGLFLCLMVIDFYVAPHICALSCPSPESDVRTSLGEGTNTPQPGDSNEPPISIKRAGEARSAMGSPVTIPYHMIESATYEFRNPSYGLIIEKTEELRWRARWVALCLAVSGALLMLFLTWSAPRLGRRTQIITSLVSGGALSLFAFNVDKVLSLEIDVQPSIKIAFEAAPINSEGGHGTEGTERPPTPTEQFHFIRSDVGEIMGFAEGEPCPTQSSAAASIAQLSKQIRKDLRDLRLVVLLGSTDSRPLSKELRARYGTNVGLAHGRAECVKNELLKVMPSNFAADLVATFPQPPTDLVGHASEDASARSRKVTAHIIVQRKTPVP